MKNGGMSDKRYRGVIIAGAGGHGQTVAEAFFAAPDGFVLAGFVDDTPALQGQQVSGVPVLGPIGSIGGDECDGMIVALGNNAARARVFGQLQAAGVRLVTVVHPRAVIATTARLGAGCYIGANAVVGAASEIGEDTVINGLSCVGHHNRIGAHVHFGPGVHAAGHVTVGDGCEVGTGANLLPGAVVGEHCVIMGGALVSGEIPPWSLFGGVPGRVLRRLTPDASAEREP